MWVRTRLFFKALPKSLVNDGGFARSPLFLGISFFGDKLERSNEFSKLNFDSDVVAPRFC